MKVIITKDYEEMSLVAAQFFKDMLKTKPNAVLGLATGGTPERMYDLLIEANKKKDVSFARALTFNLDEYIGIPQNHPMSYWTYMNTKLFDHIDIKKINTHIPNGNGDVAQNGKDYDKAIETAGGIDLQVLGIGENGHIAFNEPGSKDTDQTRAVKLTKSTIKANSRYFTSTKDVPKTAITMGIGSIMKAKKIILIASGSKKAHTIRSTVDGSVTKDVPASFLQNHPDVTIIVDEEAGKLLRQYRETALCGVSAGE